MSPGFPRIAWLFAAISAVAFYVPTAPAAKPTLLSVKKIWDAGRHNAFTDLIRFHDKFYCTFRESDGHVGGDGKLRVLVSDDGGAWKSAALLAEKGIDLRDPKLSITPDNRLMIVAGGSVYRGGRKILGRQPRVAFSKDGVKWTETRRVLAEGDWLWRVTWHKGTAYGAAYRTSPRKSGAKSSDWLLTLYKSKDGLRWDVITDLEVPNRPNETTLRFLPNDEMVALVRREAGNGHGWIGSAKSPYRKWVWTETKHRLGGPNFIRLPNGELWAGSRSYPGGAKTVLAKMTKTTYEPMLTLPSRGDTSYPGLVWHKGILWMSYYSSHLGKTSIYLARIKL
jgi:hypothetical protein